MASERLLTPEAENLHKKIQIPAGNLLPFRQSFMTGKQLIKTFNKRTDDALGIFVVLQPWC